MALQCMCLTPSPSPTCSHLNSLLKYHQSYRISLSAFQDIYTTILSLQDELEQGEATENGEADLENLSQNWQVGRAFSKLNSLHHCFISSSNSLLLVWSSSLFVAHVHPYSPFFLSSCTFLPPPLPSPPSRSLPPSPHTDAETVCMHTVSLRRDSLRHQEPPCRAQPYQLAGD